MIRQVKHAPLPGGGDDAAATHQIRTWPWIALALLLGTCLLHGLWAIRDLGLYTAILDTYRDAGFVQGFLDGNLFGDPSIDGAWRYYPPLIHALAAGLALMTRTQPLQLLICAAPWLNLLIPATFFLMVRQLIDAPTAAIATTLLVCFNGMMLPPWMAATYSPWHGVPALSQALFFCGVWLISARAHYGRFADALGIGTVIGLVFLAHTVPALVLAAVTTAAALSTQGAGLRPMAWLGIAAVAALLWTLPFMIPLVTTYHLKILNAAGSFTDPLFDPTRIPRRVIAASLPGILALVVLAWNWRRDRKMATRVSRSTIAILCAWIGLPALFLLRHFDCGIGGPSAVCNAFVVPVHHWMIYMQSALAVVFGYVVAPAFAMDRNRGKSSFPAVAAAGGIFVLAGAMLVFRPMDDQMRQRANEMRTRIDLELYRWLLTSTAPGALFVTDISTDAVHDSAAIAVLAAGRKSVALPFTFSSPYVDWHPRAERERAYLAATQPGADEGILCRLVAEAGPGDSAYIALATGMNARPGMLRLVFRGAQNSVYRVVPSSCS